MQALDFAADLSLDPRVTVQGGYDCGYASKLAAVGMLGTVRVKSGTVTLDKVRFRNGVMQSAPETDIVQVTRVIPYRSGSC